ncbi:HAMP domain-containing histidine kinase [Alcaligenaceae bacterium]|nr:HAMP domain-containing histidine kinase [Alcaligenaceae bacterium]
MQNSLPDNKRPSQHSLVLRVTYALTALVWVSVLAACFLAYEAQKNMGERVIAHLMQTQEVRLYVAYDIQALSGKFGWVLLGIALFFMVLSYLLARVLARWAVQPIQALTAHLARWAPGRPRMFGLASNEGAQLTEAFNRMQDRIDQALADQKEFSSNFNHEVRTPLALIRTDAELGKLEAACAEKVALRFERIMRSADEMTQSLEATYYLAQAEHGQVELASLYDCVNDVFARAESEAISRGLVLRNQVEKAHTELVNRHMLLTVIRNIVRNAIAHAAPGTLEIGSAGHGLIFSDDGPGVSPEDAPHLFDRYYSTRRVDAQSSADPALSPPGETGLGLAIAKRVCVVQGWGLEISDTAVPGKGLTLVLSFDCAA